MPAANQATASIRTTINYFDPAVGRGRFDLVQPELNRMGFEAHAVAVRDMRATPGEVSIERQGFMLAQHDSRAAFRPEMLDVNLTARGDIPPVNRDYYDEILPPIAKISGAREVIPQSTGLTVRFSPRSKRQSWAGAAGFAHLDVTETSVDRFLDFSLKAAGRKIAPWRRFVLFQTWRAISPAPQDNLLALCDRLSVPQRDVVFYDAAVGGKDTPLELIEARSCRYGPGHRWWYVSAMGPADLLIFVGYDSADPQAVQPFHTGIDIPGHADATPRRSLEARFFAFYD